MNLARQILAARINALADNLHRVEATLEQVGEAEGAKLNQLVMSRLAILIEEKRGKLKKLIGSVNRGLDLAADWHDLCDQTDDCQPLFTECLHLIQGALMREAGIGEQLCQLADALSNSLGTRSGISWDSLTSMAEQEFYTRTAEVIRLRFPEFSLWQLPITCHEFGHFVADEIRAKMIYAGMNGEIGQGDPFTQILQMEGKFEAHKDPDNKDISYLHEQFADLFATYVLGPSYACTCLLLRFNPITAWKDGDEHPADGKRAWFILKMLDKMSAESESHPFKEIVKKLRERWETSLVSADQQPTPGPDVSGRLEDRLEVLYERICQARLSRVKYEDDGWDRAQNLSGKLLEDLTPAQMPQVTSRTLTIPDILNAAWLCRLENEVKADQISRKALKLSLFLINLA